MVKITQTKQIGEVIYRVRKEQRLTQKQLAAMCGVGVRFIRELEKGKASCQLDKTITVINMLGIQLLINSPNSEVMSDDRRGFGSE